MVGDGNDVGREVGGGGFGRCPKHPIGMGATLSAVRRAGTPRHAAAAPIEMSPANWVSRAVSTDFPCPKSNGRFVRTRHHRLSLSLSSSLLVLRMPTLAR